LQWRGDEAEHNGAAMQGERGGRVRGRPLAVGGWTRSHRGHRGGGTFVPRTTYGERRPSRKGERKRVREG